MEKDDTLVSHQDAHETLDAIHEIALGLIDEEKSERLREGIWIIHALARHRTVPLLQTDIDDFNARKSAL